MGTPHGMMMEGETECMMKPKTYIPPLPLFTDGKVTPGCEWVIKGHGDAFNYLEGLTAWVDKGSIYKVGADNTWTVCGIEDDIYREALNNFWFSQVETPENGWHQVIGFSVYDNPYGFRGNILARVINESLRAKVSDRSFEGMQAHFERSPVFGVLFTYTRGRSALAKRSDFGLVWPPFTVMV